MKNKFYFILSIVLIFESCTQNPKDNEKTREIIIPVDSSNKNEITKMSNTSFSILGKWSMSYTKSGNSITKCNQCPSAVFEENNTAKVILSSEDAEMYNYSIVNDTLLFSYNKESKKANSNRYFDDKYLMISKTEKNYVELELKQVGKDFSFVLRK